MTSMGKYVSMDTFKRMFPEAIYNKSNEYDFMLGGKTLKTRASALGKRGSWTFVLPGNQSPDTYVLMAFDNSVDRNLLHMWCIPRDVYKKFATIYIYVSTISKWDEYRVDANELEDLSIYTEP